MLSAVVLLGGFCGFFLYAIAVALGHILTEVKSANSLLRGLSEKLDDVDRIREEIQKTTQAIDRCGSAISESKSDLKKQHQALLRELKWFERGSFAEQLIQKFDWSHDGSFADKLLRELRWFEKGTFAENLNEKLNSVLYGAGDLSEAEKEELRRIESELNQLHRSP
jgi:hypothetical protein